MNELPPFDPNGYRKRVLAAVERRGGPDTSDPFELYDLPLDAELDDQVVAARVAEVWAFWQRQRDHPRYRALVALLVETHAARSAELLDASTRRGAAARARVRREERETARFALLDAAISRLVQRHGGVPRDKVAGLEEVGALGGLTPDEVAARVRAYHLLGPSIGPERLRQIRALLDEFGRLTGAVAPPTLLALLGLVPSATDQQVSAGWTAWRSRARELPAGRLRAVVDELLVHVADLLAPGRAAVEAYLDAVAVEVTEYLRPRVRAAVLVEDRLVADDHAHLLAEAAARGLDDRRAAAVIAGLAAELGAVVEPAPPGVRGPGAASGANADEGGRRAPGGAKTRPGQQAAQRGQAKPGPPPERRRPSCCGARGRPCAPDGRGRRRSWWPPRQAQARWPGRHGRCPTRSPPCWPTPNAGWARPPPLQPTGVGWPRPSSSTISPGRRRTSPRTWRCGGPAHEPRSFGQANATRPRSPDRKPGGRRPCGPSSSTAATTKAPSGRWSSSPSWLLTHPSG